MRIFKSLIITYLALIICFHTFDARAQDQIGGGGYPLLSTQTIANPYIFPPTGPAPKIVEDGCAMVAAGVLVLIAGGIAVWKIIKFCQKFLNPSPPPMTNNPPTNTSELFRFKPNLTTPEAAGGQSVTNYPLLPNALGNNATFTDLEFGMTGNMVDFAWLQNRADGTWENVAAIRSMINWANSTAQIQFYNSQTGANSGDPITANVMPLSDQVSSSPGLQAAVNADLASGRLTQSQLAVPSFQVVMDLDNNPLLQSFKPLDPQTGQPLLPQRYGRFMSY